MLSIFFAMIEPIQSVVFKYREVPSNIRMDRIEPIQSVVFKYSIKLINF